jgi:hypothetical protein
MLEIDVGSRNVIENKRNGDVLSCYLSDILGNPAPVLTENAHLGATKSTFSVRFSRQCAALAMPRCESQNLPDARRCGGRTGCLPGWQGDASQGEEQSPGKRVISFRCS